MIKNLKIQIPKGYEIDVDNSTFHNIVFKKIESRLPKTWEEFCEQNSVVKSEYYIAGNSYIFNVVNGTRNTTLDANLFKTREEAEALLTLIKLYRLRQAYVDDWKPDWNSYNEQKFVIKTVKNNLTISTHHNEVRSFSFPTFEMATEFLKNFKAELEQVKDLI